jgi:hypothetical protein
MAFVLMLKSEYLKLVMEMACQIFLMRCFFVGDDWKTDMEFQNVFDAGCELWRYYHSQNDCNVNASLYDIREYFQERNDNDNDKGKMNSKGHVKNKL